MSVLDTIRDEAGEVAHETVDLLGRLGRGALRTAVGRVPAQGLDGLDPDCARVVRLFGAPLHTLPVPMVRALYEVQGQAWRRPHPDGVRVVDRRVGLPPDATGPGRSITVRTATPPHPTGGALVHVHGGGWTIGSVRTHDAIARRLAAGSGAVVHTVGYRLAPEHPFPAGMTDVLQAWRLLRDEHVAGGGDPARIGIGGDSAGGHAGTMVANEAVEPTLGVEVPVPGFTWLTYPAVAFRGMDSTARTFPAGVLLTGPMIRFFTEQHVGDGDLGHPALNPLDRSDEVLAQHPRTWLQTVAFDPLCEEGTAYAQRLAALGVDVEHDHDPHLLHDYVHLTGVSTASARAQDRGVTALRRLVSA